MVSLPVGERRVLRAMIGHDLLAVEYERSGDVESAYLRFEAGYVEFAAVQPPIAEGWPWRMAVNASTGRELDFPPDLEPRHSALGRIRSVEIYAEQTGVECVVALAFDARPTLWAFTRGGDFVDSQLGDAPAWPVVELTEAFPAPAA